MVEKKIDGFSFIVAGELVGEGENAVEGVDLEAVTSGFEFLLYLLPHTTHLLLLRIKQAMTLFLNLTNLFVLVWFGLGGIS